MPFLQRFALPFCLFILLAGPGRFAARGQEVLDGVAAVVNNDVITFSQVRDLVGARERAARESLKGEDLLAKVKEIRLAAVNDLIDRQLILQEFENMKKKGAAIPAHVLDDHIDTIVREQFGGDRTAFIRTLTAQGFTIDKFRQMELEKIVVQAMRGQQVKNTIIIPEEQIKERYKKSLEEFTSEDQMKLRMLVMKKSGDDAAGRLKQVQEIRAKILAGAAFEDLARMYDEDSNQEQGGDWGWINRHTLNESLTKVAFALKPGEVSKIIEMAGNYYVLFCEAKKASVTKGLAEVHDAIEKQLVQEERQRIMADWLAKLRKKAFIKIY